MLRNVGDGTTRPGGRTETTDPLGCLLGAPDDERARKSLRESLGGRELE